MSDCLHPPKRFAGRWTMGILAGVALAMSGQARAAEPGTLIIHATGFKHTRGHAMAKLFVPGDRVLGPGRWQRTAPIEASGATFRFDGLREGQYAAVVFHDENDNGEIDHGLFGPSEPLGFPGGFILSLLSGRPDFDRLKFEFTLPEQTLEVRVR